MNYGMELWSTEPKPKTDKLRFQSGHSVLLRLGEHADATRKSQMMMGVPQTTMSKWQLSFFTFQSISEVLKSSISLSAFTVMIDHQREESIAKIHWIWFYKCLVIWPLDQTSTSWQSTHKTYHYCRTGFPQDKWIIHLTCHHIM